jgi:hypothetical protein
LRAFPKWKKSTHRLSSLSPRYVIFTHSQETSTLHSLRQQLADAVNARDVAKVHEQAAHARAATMESLRAASEAAAAEAAAAAAHEIASLRCSLDLVQQDNAELQRLLQQKDSDFSEAMRSASAQAANSSAIMLELQQSYRYIRNASGRHWILFILCSIALQELEKFKGDSRIALCHPMQENSSHAEHKIADAHLLAASGSITPRQRYPKTSFESLLSGPSPSPNVSNGLAPPALAAAVSEVDAQQLQLHVSALELQVSTLRDALSDAQDQCSLFEKQCNWFKKMELELQLSRDRNSSASDLDYLRRLVVASQRALCP